MDKEEAIKEFLKTLRISINSASIYFKEHPSFKKSVENLKEKADSLLNFLTPFKINITTNSLFIDGKYWQKEPLYSELAQMFHTRKIKSIEIKQGITFDELLDLLIEISRPRKEIIRKETDRGILPRKEDAHFSIQELDYSQILQDKGKELKDPWIYLFREAIEKEASQQIDEYVNNFKEIIEKIKIQNLCENDELRQNIHNFVNYLRDKKSDGFESCSKELLKLFLKGKDILQADELEKIKIFFKNVPNNILVDTLFDEILKNDQFDHLSFQIFSRLIDENKNREVAVGLEQKLKNVEALKFNLRVRKKIMQLFSMPDGQPILPIYRNIIFSVFKDVPAQASFSFDRKMAQSSYRSLLLNLFSEEKDNAGLDLIVKHLLKELDGIINDKEMEYLKFLFDVLDKKMVEVPEITNSLKELQKRISHFVENCVFEEGFPFLLEQHLGRLKKTDLGLEHYLDKIFNENKVNPHILKLFLNFFAQDLGIFYKHLEKRASDLDFLEKIVQSLKQIDSPLSKEILKYVFGISNTIIKAEILKIMQGFPQYDTEFLLSVLKEDNIFLKKSAILILANDTNTQKAALAQLLYIPSPWGKKNKLILENLMVIEDLELKESKDYLISLTKRPFFWNRKLRKKAKELLKKYDHRED